MPSWEGEIRARLAGLRLTPERELELVEELCAHLDDDYQERLAAGAAPEPARLAALAGLKDNDTLARELRPLRQARMPEKVAPGAPSGSLLADVGQDIRYGLRRLKSAPGFTAAAVLTLALGIGANAAIFSLVNAVLLQRLPVRESQRVVHASFRGSNLAYPHYEELRDHQEVFDGFAVWGGIVASLTERDEAEQVTGAIVTGNYFDVLGVQPALGRLLHPSDDVTPGAHPVAVLGHAFWRTRFGARSDVVGRELLLNGHKFTVVGIAPEGFFGSQLGARRNLFVPMMMQAVVRPPRAGYSGEMDPDLLKRRDNRWLTGLGRLRPGIGVEQAQASLQALATRLQPERPADAGPIRFDVVPVDVGDPRMRARVRAAATLLLCVVAAVLLLACANVANLLLSRAAARRREIAVRLAIGASRWRLVRQLLTESLLLSLAGGALGLLLAFWILAAFEAAPPPTGAIPFAIQVSIDGRVLSFTAALAVLAGVVFGLAPALAATGTRLVPALKDESFVPDERSRRFNLRGALVVSQVGLSLALLVAAGLFLKTLRNVQAVDPGFDVERLLSAQLPVNLLRYTQAQGRDFYRRVVESVEALPGVESASVARVPLLSDGGRVSSLHIEGRSRSNDQFQSEGGGRAGMSRDAISSNVIGPRYFETLGIELLAGRDFDERDAAGAPAVVVVNEAFRRLHFPELPRRELLSRRLSLSSPTGPWLEIVGVVSDGKYWSLTESSMPVAYVPLAQRHETGVVLYVRATGDPARLVPAVRSAVRALEPNLPMPELRTLSETVASSLYVPRMGSALLGVFAGLALFLAAIGVYGVTSFAIAQRTREIGVRMALGARAQNVLALVLDQGMRLVAYGVGLGLLLALAAARSLEAFLFGVSGRDAATLVAVPLLLAAVAFLACLVPARRAMKLDPLAALRYR